MRKNFFTKTRHFLVIVFLRKRFLESKLFLLIVSKPSNARWAPMEVKVASDNGKGDVTSLLWDLACIDIDADTQSIVITDLDDHRIVEWKMGEKNGTMVADSQGQGSRLGQSDPPMYVVIDKDVDNLLIADYGNWRVLRRFRRRGRRQDQVIDGDIVCWELVSDHQRHLYVSDWDKDEVRRYIIRDKNGIVVAGGSAQGNQLDQLNYSTYFSVNKEQTV